MFIPGRKRRSDSIQCMCRNTLGGILKFDRHCNLSLNLFYGAHCAFSNQQEDQDTRPTHTTEKNISVIFSNSWELDLTLTCSRHKKKEKKKRTLSVQNISDVAVTINFDQGHQNWHKNITFTGVYPTAQFERSRIKSVQGPKIKVFVEFVKAKIITFLRCM